jgi:hypothetical protein
MRILYNDFTGVMEKWLADRYYYWENVWNDGDAYCPPAAVNIEFPNDEAATLFKLTFKVEHDDS